MKSKQKSPLQCGGAHLYASKYNNNNSSNGKWMLTFLLLGLFVAATQAVDEKSVKSLPAAPSSTLATKDEFYIDDEPIDGSGGRGGIHDDLEKEPDYSGSGFGPDDEDAITDHHSSHNTRVHTQNANSNTHTPTTPPNKTAPSVSSTDSTNSSTTVNSNLNPIPTNNSSNNSNNNSSNNNTITPTPLPHPDLTLVPSSTRTPSVFHLPDAKETAVDEEDDIDIDEDGFDGSGDHDDDEDEDDTIIDPGLDTAGGDDDDDDLEQIDRHPDEELHKTVHKPLDTPKHIVELNNKHDNDNDEDDLSEENGGDSDIYTDINEPNLERDGSTKLGPGTTNNQGTIHELDPNNNINSQPTDTKVIEHTPGNGNEVLIMSEDDRTTSFFAQPGILAAVIGGAVVGLLCAILVVMFIVYRMRKKDEGSYALDEPKRSPANNSYAKNANNREFYA